MHLPACRCRQRSDDEIIESRTRVCAAAFPAADHIVALGNEISSAPEIKVWKRLTEPEHERLDVRPAATQLMQ